MPGERILPPTRAVFAAPFLATTSGAESLLIRVWCGRFGAAPATPEAVAVTYRLVARDGSSQLSGSTIAPTTDRVVTASTVLLGDGLLQDLTVQWAGAASLSGLCYVAVYLQRGVPPGATRIVAQIVGGYVTPGQGLAWPGGLVLGSLAGVGFQHAVAAAVPAAGAQAMIVQPAGTAWGLVTARGAVTMGPAGPVRSPALVVTDAAAVEIARVGTAVTMANNQSQVLTWLQGVPLTQMAGGDFLGPVPTGFVSRGGSTYATVIGGGQVTDQWTSFAVLVEEWLEASV